MKRLLTVFALLAAMAVFVCTPASAQTLNMDMSWGMNQQAMLQNYNNAYAQYMAQYYYNYMQALRRAGYTGPSLDTGFNAQTLQQAGAAANAATGRFIQSGMNGSDRRANASADYDLRAIRGCYLYNNVYYCP